MKIGLLTWHYHNNIGSNLQAYAIQKAIQKLGYETEFINYQKETQPIYKNILKNMFVLLDTMLPNSLNEKYRFGAFQFQSQYFNESKVVHSYKELECIVNSYDCVICGSDQIWAPSVFDPIYFLSFVPENIKKISYAPSIGLPDIPKECREEYNTLLKRFDAISIREKEGANILEKYFEIHASLVLDPTLLLSIDEWKQLYSKEKAPCSEPYIFCYFLGIKEWHRKKVYDYAKKNNYKLVILSNDLSSRKYADVFYEQMGPKKFLKSIESASVVFTDSYHGTLFSLLYEKIFYVFNRFDDDDKICQNSRIDNISELFSIENQRIKSFDDECFCLPNYREIKNKLNELKKDSFDYLNDALHI